MLMSSLTADDPARGKVGGGVCTGLSLFQNPRPLEFRAEPMLNAPNSPLVEKLSSRLILPSGSSSGTPSSGPSNPGTAGKRLGDDCVVADGRSKSSASRT
jgi:hypothetical protein